MMDNENGGKYYERDESPDIDEIVDSIVEADMDEMYDVVVTNEVFNMLLSSYSKFDAVEIGEVSEVDVTPPIPKVMVDGHRVKKNDNLYSHIVKFSHTQYLNVRKPESKYRNMRDANNIFDWLIDEARLDEELNNDE